MIQLGQRLHDERLLRKLTLDQIATATKIRPRFLDAIERGEYDRLPSAAYAQGFVRNYASYLGLSQREALALFRREFDEKKAYKVLPDSLVKRKEFPLHRIRVQQSFYLLTIIFIVLLGYFGFQYRSMFIPPPLSLNAFTPNSLKQHETIISGTTDPNAAVIINNDPVSVNIKGEYTKTVSLFPGSNTITIKATNRYGKESVVQKVINVK